jgi:hypothetical protein
MRKSLGAPCAGLLASALYAALATPDRPPKLDMDERRALAHFLDYLLGEAT